MKNSIAHTKILIAPLDWGLGHATRCIPLIHFLMQLECEVFIASSGAQKKLLQAEFHAFSFLHLEGYNITYSKHKRIMPLKILWQTPKILSAIKKENKWLSNTIEQYKIDVVISDNRYGLYSSKVPCIFITHQLQIQAAYNSLNKFIQKINYQYINRFSECWIPDAEGENNIAGNLSHPKKLPAIPVKYIGPLSRFEIKKTEEKKYDWMIILSGPEPQRTVLENKLLFRLSALHDKILIVRGKPGDTVNLNVSENFTIFNHAATAEMQQLINESEFIISRCGYTTVMEMLSLQKKCVLIPTPGQTEQEYLAAHLKKQAWCYSFQQDDDFLLHLNNAKEFTYNLPAIDTSAFKKILADFVNQLTT